MDVIQLHFSVLTLKLIGYTLGLLFAARALNRLNSLNIDIAGKPVKINANLLILPLLVLLISPVFDFLYEVYLVHEFQHISMVAEGLAGLMLAYAFLKFYKALEED